MLHLLQRWWLSPKLSLKRFPCQASLGENACPEAIGNAERVLLQDRFLAIGRKKWKGRQQWHRFQVWQKNVRWDFAGPTSWTMAEKGPLQLRCRRVSSNANVSSIHIKHPSWACWNDKYDLWFNHSHTYHANAGSKVLMPAPYWGCTGPAISKYMVVSLTYILRFECCNFQKGFKHNLNIIGPLWMWQYLSKVMQRWQKRPKKNSLAKKGCRYLIEVQWI